MPTRTSRPESRVISFANQKGGVGKTTCVHNIGHALAMSGRSVAVLDLDPQAHLTAAFGYNPDEIAEPGVCEVLRGDYDVELLTPDAGGGVRLLPSNLTLAGVELQLAGEPGRDFVLRGYIEKMQYDYILIDCPPSLGVLTVNALTASGSVVIPMQAEYLPFRGVKGLLQAIQLIRTRLNPELDIEGVVITRYDKRKILSRDVLSQIEEFFGDRAYQTKIRENISVAEAPAHGKSIFEYAPESHGAQDFWSLAEEIIQKEGGEQK